MLSGWLSGMERNLAAKGAKCTKEILAGVGLIKLWRHDAATGEAWS
jgi:hypothetical protein